MKIYKKKKFLNAYKMLKQYTAVIKRNKRERERERATTTTKKA